jgi:eight-cysteine-cluster-containing protein
MNWLLNICIICALISGCTEEKEDIVTTTTSYTIPVRETIQTVTSTTSPPECNEDSDCVRTGCSSEICIQAEKAGDVITDCSVRPHYECLQVDRCGCIGGRCGWEKNTEFKRCIVKVGAKMGAVL